jgi:hypothetical protein
MPPSEIVAADAAYAKLALPAVTFLGLASLLATMQQLPENTASRSAP